MNRRMSEVSDPYVPNLNPPYPPAGLGFNNLYSGEGAPSNSLGTNGDLYVNVDTGDIYAKENNVWALQSGGGGGGVQQLFQGNSDPVSAPTDPSKPAIFFNHNTGYGWRWDVSDAAWS